MADLNPHSKTDPAVVYKSIEAEWKIPNISPTTPTQSEQHVLSEILAIIEKLLKKTTEESAKPVSERYVKQRKHWGIIIFSCNGGCSYTANLNIKKLKFRNLAEWKMTRLASALRSPSSQRENTISHTLKSTPFSSLYSVSLYSWPVLPCCSKVNLRGRCAAA